MRDYLKDIIIYELEKQAAMEELLLRGFIRDRLLEKTAEVSSYIKYGLPLGAGLLGLGLYTMLNKDNNSSSSIPIVPPSQVPTSEEGSSLLSSIPTTLLGLALAGGLGAGAYKLRGRLKGGRIGRILEGLKGLFRRGEVIEKLTPKEKKIIETALQRE